MEFGIAYLQLHLLRGFGLPVAERKTGKRDVTVSQEMTALLLVLAYQWRSHSDCDVEEVSDLRFKVASCT
jgi:hypothetical protein